MQQNLGHTPRREGKKNEAHKNVCHDGKVRSTEEKVKHHHDSFIKIIIIIVVGSL